MKLYASPVTFTIALACFCTFVFAEGRAHAYLDPGAGSYVFQTVIAGIAGALYSVKLFWKQIVSAFRRVLSKPAQN